MGNDIEFRSFVSKVYLTRGLSAGNPGFLERNLRHVLDSHERELACERKPAKASECAGMAEHRGTRRHSWDFPSDRITEELMKSNKARLRIKSLLLQDPTKATASAGRQVKRPQQKEQPDWLLEPDQVQLPCQIVATVNEARSLRRTISTAARQGTITKHGKSTFRITFNEPFVLHADDLDVHTPSFTATGPWKTNFFQDYSLEFGIHCQDSDDTAKFLSQLEKKAISESLTVPGNEDVVKCSWTGLPALPQADEPLTLHRIKGHHKITLNYVALIDMAWNKRESPLSTYNKVLRKARNEPRRLPTPSEEPERAGGKTLLKYSYRQGLENKGMPVDHLRCIFCLHNPEHATFERLHLHYLLRHDHFQYDVILKESEDGDDLRTIRISHEDDKHPSGEKEFEWEAPRRAFDISAHLKGTNSWTVRTTKPMTTKGSGRPRKEQPLVLMRPKKRDFAPEEIDELPNCTKKRCVVPHVPGVKFYRTKSKQSVKPGTLLSDSEEDVDETWLLQRQQQHRAKLGVSKITQQFNELLNRHLDIENRPQSDVLVRDAVVRFARQHATKLAQPGWKEEFESKLKRFQSVNVIDAAIVQFCQGKISKAEQTLDGPTPVLDEDKEQPPNTHTSTVMTPNRRIREKLPSQVRVTAAVFAKSRDAEPGGAQTESPVPIGAIPESPVGTPSGKNRMRWAGGRMKSASVEPQNSRNMDVPLGQRTLICIRPARDGQGQRSTGELPIIEFTKDSQSRTPIEEIQPSHLDYKKFLRVLDNDLSYIRAVDNIVCVSNATRRPVVDENDWLAALKEVQAEDIGPIQFLLGPLRLIMSSQGSTPKKVMKKVKQPVFAARQKKPCVCGEYVNSLRNTIGCGNPKCHRDFHMPCVQLQKRSMDWLCMDCSS